MNRGKLSLLLLLVSLLAVISIIGYASKEWNDQIERSGIEATKKLESDGIKIRTVDTSALLEVESGEISQEDEPELKSEKASNEDQPPVNDNQTESSGQKENGNKLDEENKDNTKKPNTDVVVTNAVSNTSVEINGNSDSNTTKETAPSQVASKSLLEIKQMYMQQFLKLESEISTSLETILNEAFTDYSEKVNNNQQIDLKEFQKKYATKVVELEAVSDSRFNEIYKRLEAELIANGYDINEALPYQAQYRVEKQNREQKAIQKFSSIR